MPRILPAFASLALAMAVCASAALARDDVPYVGRWNCEVATFVFTAETYDAGEGPMPILKSIETDGTHALTLPNDYRIHLSNVTATEMDWFSEASGDGFHCKRVAD